MQICDIVRLWNGPTMSNYFASASIYVVHSGHQSFKLRFIYNIRMQHKLIYSQVSLRLNPGAPQRPNNTTQTQKINIQSMSYWTRPVTRARGQQDGSESTESTIEFRYICVCVCVRNASVHVFDFTYGKSDGLLQQGLQKRLRQEQVLGAKNSLDARSWYYALVVHTFFAFCAPLPLQVL